MASLELIRQMENGAINSSLSLLDYTDGINLYDWTQSTPGKGPVVETLGLRIRGNNTNGVADVVQSIDQKIRETQQYFQGNDLYQVWLKAQLDSESYPRKAFVHNITGGPNRTMMDQVFNKSHRINDYTLAIERGPYWEDTVNTIAGTYGAASHAFDLNTTIAGDVPARIHQVDINYWGRYIYWSEVWLGFRSDRFGSHSAFDPKCLFDGGYPRVDTSISGYNAICTFATTESMAERVYLRLDKWSGNESEYRGEFQVLLVAKVETGMTVDIRMRHGFFQSHLEGTWVTHNNRVRLTSTVALVLDMGVVRFPFGRGTGSNVFMRGHAIGFDAELISGSGDLTFYRVILIPRSEGFLYVKGSILDDTEMHATVHTHPEGRIEGFWLGTDGSGVVQKALELSTNNWSLPVGSVRVCWAACATEANGGYIAAHDIQLVLRYAHRWRTLKGAG